MPRPFPAVPFIFNSIASPINIQDLDTDFAQILTDFNDSSIGYTNWGADSGIANAYVVTIPASFAAYAAGMVVAFLPANTNVAGGSTVNVNGIGTITILDVIGNQPAAGEIQSNRVTYLVYDGTVFRLVNSTITGGVPYYYDWDDFVGGPKFLIPVTTGTGVGQAYTTQVVGHPGIYSLTSGNSAARLSTSLALFLDSFTWTIRSIISPVVIATGANMLFGMDSNPGFNLALRNGIWIYGLQGTANWQCRCSTAGANTTVDSGIAFSPSVWHDMMIVASTASVSFFIDGSLVTTITTNIPASTTVMAIEDQCSSGGGNSALLVDTFEILVQGVPQLGTKPRFLLGAV